MPEANGGVTIGELRRVVGQQLGYGRDPTTWSTNQTTDVSDVLKTGLNQFYYPARTIDNAPAYQWGFLKPLGAITLESGVDEYDMPESYASLIGNLFFDYADYSTREVIVVNQASILRMKQRQAYDVVEWYPRYAAIVPHQANELSAPRYRIMLWPKPDSAYTLRFQYYARQSASEDDNAVPLGGVEHSETIRASCRAAAELHMDDEMGTRAAHFKDRLQASIDFDRKASSPQNIGYNSDNSERMRGRHVRSSQITTYEKYGL